MFRFVFDANGNMTKKEYPNNEVEYYAYDANNQKTRQDEFAKNGMQKTYTTYTYDQNGNIIKVTDPRGTRTGYVYDALDRKRIQIRCNK